MSYTVCGICGIVSLVAGFALGYRRGFWSGYLRAANDVLDKVGRPSRGNEVRL